jgi:hypothetical protein
MATIIILTDQDHQSGIEADVDALVAQGYIAYNAQGGLVLTDKGIQAIDDEHDSAA